MSTVSDSMAIRCGLISITDVSRFLTIRFTVHTLGICLHIDQKIRIVFSHLGIKGVELQLIRALKGLRVDLFKGNPVELALKDVDLFHVVIGAPDIVALSG